MTRSIIAGCSNTPNSHQSLQKISNVMGWIKQQQQLLSVVLSLLILSACHTQPNQEATKTYKSPCGCVITDRQMIMQCPIDAVGDSITICKVGTNNVIGSNRGPMTWSEYLQSEYSGGEGLVVDCKTGSPVFKNVQAPKVKYKNKRLVVDSRYQLDVYDPRKKSWVQIYLPVWRREAYAVKGELKTTRDSLVFQPPYHGKAAFDQVAKEYEEEVKKPNHYMITSTVFRLLMCAVCGDKLSQSRLLTIRKDFSEYYDQHEDSQLYLDQSLDLFKAYQSYLDQGGKRQYFDLSQFVYFKQNLPKPTKAK